MTDGDERSLFGELLLKHRRFAGLSQQALALKSGMSVRALRELEHGRARAAQRRSAEILADALELIESDRTEFLSVAREGRRRSVAVSSFPGAAELPPLPPDLVGREAEVEQLRALISSSPAVAVVGQAGVGKTVLAAHLARELHPEFPGGCLALDLRGADEEPLPVQVVFVRLLRALGVAPADLPATEAEQAARYRAILERRKVLVLLDNAASEEQVRPVLAAASGSDSRTVVTCRRTLAGLQGLRWFSLGPFEDADAQRLLSAILGEDRVHAEPGEARELAALCGNLPLALRIVGNRLATRPHWTLAYLAKQLRDERTRLAALSAGDLQVRSAFEISYRRLSTGGREVFCRLAAVPGEDFGVELVQVAAELTELEADAYLGELVDASMLLTAPEPGRFRFHDLLRIFAREQWKAEHDPAERYQTTEAVLDHLLSTACAAASLYFPVGPYEDLFTSREEAGFWLDRERSNWLAAQQEAARLGRHGDVLVFAKAMHWYSDDNWHLPWVEVFARGVEAAQALGDVAAEAQQRNFLGWAVRPIAGNERAMAEHERALRLAIEAEDQLEQTWALAYLAVLHFRLDDREEALILGRQAAELSVSFGFWDIQIPVRYRLGMLLLWAGRSEEALEVQQRLLDEVEGRGQNGEMLPARSQMAAVVLDAVAQCLQAMKLWRKAADMFAAARRTQLDVGAGYFAALAALGEGRCRIEEGEYESAREALTFALTLFETRSIPDRAEEARTELARLQVGS
ncbi:NB-ARC domain-containing protein [Lentzea sp. NPDC004782]|uniref:AAA family ATPase n=1 Tax=Lentzea sp. NPDC004782 TaxID=3154458 RepID=UPI0033B79690